MTITPNPAHRGDPVWLADALRHWGVKVVEMPGYLHWGNGDFGRIQGVVCHHTGALNTPASYIARNPRLGNQLSSQIHLSRDGVATLCGIGIAWHAGRGSYPGWPTDNANRVSIGIEAVSDGRAPWPKAQMVAYRKCVAAILWYLGLPATTQHVLGHKEYSGRAQGKWDPGGIDMDTFRREVQWYLDNPPWKTPAPAPPPAANPGKDPAMNDARLDLILDQLAGPRAADGKQNYAGWDQLGGRTLVDAVAAIGEKLGVEGMKAP